MCGIAGLCGSRDEASTTASVARMVGAMARRGPDSEGVHHFPGAVLGHRRLSIFDLSPAGHQPMLTPDGRLGVVFNGAIYNFHELRAQLESASRVFRSRTDTEVLLHGYAEWGIHGLVGRLRGMFAFGLWDAATETLYLVRDRLGVKPLFYAARNGSIAFASTAAALRSSGAAADIDAAAVAEFLEYGYVTDDRSIYEGVRKVPAAGIVEWRAGRTTEHEYWTLPEAASSGPSFDEAVEETERLLLESVRLRLEADVPVGALLSAGVDSSLVCWAMAKLGADITAFTVATKGDPLDESAEAIATARQLKLRHQVIDLSPDETPAVAEMTAAYGEPFACSSALGMLRVSRAVKSSATVLLTGDGGDDVFLGYPEHRHLFMAQRFARLVPPPLAAAWPVVRTAVPRAGVLRRAVHFADYATGGIGEVARAHPGWDVYQRSGMLGERLRDARIGRREQPRSAASARNLLAEFLREDRRTRFTGEYMTKVDGGAMHYALEARSPFLDQRMWEFAARLPFEVRLQGGRLKAVLRELARRHIGDRVAFGPKRGFGIPANRWLVTRWRADFERKLRDSLLDREGWIRRDAVLAAFERAVAAGEASNQLWYIYVLEQWLRREHGEETLSVSRPPHNAAHG